LASLDAVGLLLVRSQDLCLSLVIIDSMPAVN
jgi:hypothetical protein